MSSPLAIREALAAYITANVTGLRTQTDPGSIANPPVAIVLPALGTYIDYTMALNAGVYDITLRILILISRASERAGFEQLDGWLAPYGTTSIVAAILKDPTIGGACDYCIPTEASGIIPVSYATVDYFGAEIICKAGAE